MGIQVVCRCGQQFQAREELAGHLIPCSTCGQQVHVPAAQQLVGAVAQGAPAAVPTAMAVPMPTHTVAQPAYQQPAYQQPAYQQAAPKSLLPQPPAKPPRSSGFPIVLIAGVMVFALFCLVAIGGAGIIAARALVSESRPVPDSTAQQYPQATPYRPPSVPSPTPGQPTAIPRQPTTRQLPASGDFPASSPGLSQFNPDS